MARIRSNPLGGTTYGTNSDDEIQGSYYDDVIFGGGGDDVIRAGKGNGSDTIEGGAGADSIDGEGGNDTVTFARAPVYGSSDGVSVDLFTGRGFWGDAEGDTYFNIENVTGSNHDDAIRGNAGANVLNGLDGDDIISGGAGADTMDGGAGVDWLSYFYFASSGGPAPAQSAGVTVNLATNTASGGDAQGDVISNFENVRGSAGRDALTGSRRDNTLEGYGDDDAIDGAGGNDRLDGGAGNDTIFGGTGSDTIIGGSDNDRLAGGEGADTFVFNINAGYTPGNDRIYDFQHGVDHLMFNVAGPGSTMDELTITQVGNNTVITYDDVPGSVTLLGVSVSELSASDFQFI